MVKEKILKIRISEYLKSRAKDCASSYEWSLSQYIRFLIRMDVDSPIYQKIIPLIKENVDTLDKIQEFTHEGRRFLIIPENQENLKKSINEILINKKEN